MITSDIQKLEPGSKIALFELDLTEFGAGVLRFHAHTQAESIWWQGVEYAPAAIHAEGFELNGEGAQPTPTVSVNNTDGVMGALCVHFDDLVGAKFTRRVTLAKYLDAVNFEEGNPEADPTQHFPNTVYFIEQKTYESKDRVDFILKGALDLQGKKLPARQVMIDPCGHLLVDRKCGGGYRGAYCGYTGLRMFDRDGNPVTDPTLDVCGGRVSDCKKRFGEFEVLNYGSFPSADTARGY